ncbi:MAG: carbohydrate kinase, partial [Chloroflexi bacterium]|nr:carbohydrate kinase [Chloroflexota bacterium]
MGSKTVRPLVLTIDVGSSSVRAAIYDANASRVPGLEARLGHELVTTPDGGVVADAEHIASLVEEALDMVLTAAGDVAGHIAGVAMDTIASSVLGVDDGGSPVTPIYTYADTRPTAEVAALKRELDVAEVYDRTGCPQHTSYLPARVLWLRNAFPELSSRLSQWADVGAFLYRRWFGKTVPMSYSMASWTGMLDRRRLEWDAGLMEHLSLTADHLPPLDDYSSGQRGLAPDYANRWPALADVPFFLSIGDGAGANVGSGCVSAESVALTVGTSGAMRTLVPDAAPKIPEGLWGYRLGDSTLIGGSLTDGGSVYAWARETLNL